MAGKFFDRVGRVIMLSLAGMITLSIIGAIASIPSGIVGSDTGGGRPAPPVPPEQLEPQPPQESRPQPRREEGMAGQRGSRVAAPAAPERAPAERWLEAIFYALLALAGTAALVTLMLWRGILQVRRVADAAERVTGRR